VLVGRTAQIERKAGTDWDVLAYDGKLLGTLRLPRNFSPRALASDRLYGVEKDELDVEAVVVYRIRPPG
jgi:hypothetical protein